ncbi:hypothetical protein E4T66_17165 [Sinimarinibacterium sp. CAU 1509]|uniref:hypothetical protein n=1 Tax=Sinimarinibacterium sp. CAU 1509 TaxID=2562283 RepID=UPI0010AD2C26|nr:hypothetical protein [Sinimarinibacterium sp. CAU 1509]TJY57141.1 hypothetical protein E4T66_17165 [Sinimarinibacterium sp. CAU 1509]
MFESIIAGPDNRARHGTQFPAQAKVVCVRGVFTLPGVESEALEADEYVDVPLLGKSVAIDAAISKDRRTVVIKFEGTSGRICKRWTRGADGAYGPVHGEIVPAEDFPEVAD